MKQVGQNAFARYREIVILALDRTKVKEGSRRADASGGEDTQTAVLEDLAKERLLHLNIKSGRYRNLKVMRGDRDERRIREARGKRLG